MSLRNMLDQALLGRQAGKSFQAVLILNEKYQIQIKHRALIGRLVNSRCGRKRRRRCRCGG